MKKILFTLALLLAAAFSANAQLKVEAGVGFADYRNNNAFNPRVGFNGGVLYDWSVGSSGVEDMYMEFGLRYAMKNVCLRNDKSATYDLSWLEVPIIFGSDWNFTSSFGLYAGAGLYYGFDLTQKIGGTNVLDTIYQISKRHDFGWCIDLGLRFARHFGIGLNLTSGFLDIAALPDATIRTSNFAILASYKF